MAVETRPLAQALRGQAMETQPRNPYQRFEDQMVGAMGQPFFSDGPLQETGQFQGVTNADVAAMGAGFAPGFGEAMDVSTMVNALKNQDYGEAGMAAGALALPAVGAGSLGWLMSRGDLSSIPDMLRKQMGATAYHGTPHDFDAFDVSKMGTGEGAQAYGHGLYFAENPDVAKMYRDQVSGDYYTDASGNIIDPRSFENINIRAVLNKTGGDIDAALERGRGLSLDRLPEETRQMALRDMERLENLKQGGGLSGTQGRLYEVDIPDEDIDRMLDWDEPLSNQPEAVKSAIKQLPYDQRAFFTESNIPGAAPKAGEAYSSLAEYIGSGDHNLGSQYLAEDFQFLGIPGIKYLDEGSRAQGQGTRNFVVFDDKNIKIKSKE